MVKTHCGTFSMALYVSPSVEWSLTLMGNDVPSPGGELDVESESALTLLPCREITCSLLHTLPQHRGTTVELVSQNNEDTST